MYATKLDRLVSAYLEKNGMTLGEFAEVADIPRETLARARKGRGLTFENAYSLAAALGITLDTLYRITH